MESQNLIDRRLFNVDLFVPNKKMIQELGLLEVTKPMTKMFNSDNFHEEGLFSTVIFGAVGSEIRKKRFGYIDLKLPILHPLIYQKIVKLRKVYDDIASSKSFAIFNEETKDFDIVPEHTEGSKTGISFLFEYLERIEFKETGSDKRTLTIKLVKRFLSEEARLRYLLVMPAAYREYTVNKKGVPTEDEINGIYRKILLQSGYLANTIVTNMNISSFDVNRYLLQKHVCTLFDHIVSLLDGKEKFIQGKWASRELSYGTRNVAAPMKLEIKDLDDPRNFTYLHSIMGVYQTAVAIAPLTKKQLHDKFISQALSPTDDAAMLINKETLRTERVLIPRKTIEKWTSTEGLTEIINKLEHDYVKASPVKIDNYYLALVYDIETEVHVIFNTDFLDESFDKTKLRPITYIEMFYIILSIVIDRYNVFVTRYPVVEQGSIYPSKIYLMSTTKGRDVTVHLHNETYKLKEYPIIGEEFLRTMSPHNSRLKGLACDFDGDIISGNVPMTEEANQEVREMMNNPAFYLTPTGNLLSSLGELPLNLVLFHLSKE